MSKPIKLAISPLLVPLRTSFKQASSTRNTGESIWLEAKRGKITGYGEGCPRPYVTGETIESCVQWLTPRLDDIINNCTDLSALREMVTKNRAEIDENPAAWCGVESALLDLFARENHCSVEKLLGWKDPEFCFQYSAILGDSSTEKYAGLVKRYLKTGFTDFKIKLNGDLQKDQWKLDTLEDLCESAGVKKYRVRFDANNLWAGQTQMAIDHLNRLKATSLGIEEPVEPKNFKALEKISTSLNLSVILDESLCNEQDLMNYNDLSGNYIANIKVSRVGGVLRSLKMIDELKKRNWKIIIGAHVGETSVMTRAGMIAAQAAGENLIAQEGGFGMILLEKEPVSPSLMFGARGQLDLSKPYVIQSKNGLVEIPMVNWREGWGLTRV